MRSKWAAKACVVLLLMKIKILIIRHNPQNINLMFCGLNSDYISISSNTTQALATHFDFIQLFFSSWPLLFYSQGVFG